MYLPYRNTSCAKIILTLERERESHLSASRNYRVQTDSNKSRPWFPVFSPSACSIHLGYFPGEKASIHCEKVQHAFLRYLMNKYYFMIHPASYIVWMWFGFPSSVQMAWLGCHLSPPLLVSAYLLPPSLLSFCLWALYLSPLKCSASKRK